MKNKLLLTTALAGVAFAFAANVKPAGAQTFTSDRVVNGAEYNGSSATTKSVLTNGGQNGYGADHSSRLTVNDSKFTNNKYKTQKKAVANGAALYNDAILVVNGSMFEKNIAGKGFEATKKKPGGSGGAIYNTEKGTLTVTDSSFTGNKALGGEDISTGSNGSITTGRGGAIYTEGSTTITGSEFSSNSADVAGGAITIFGAKGETNNTPKVTISESDFIGNTAGVEDDIDGFGGAIFSKFAELTITNSNFENNTAFGGEEGYSFGGAIDAEAKKGTLTITGNGVDGRFVENTAGLDGGAIYAQELKSLNIDNILFERNVANEGGAISTSAQSAKITNSTFLDNQAKGTDNMGGAIYADEGTLEVSNTLFDGNNAGNGGAVYLDGSEKTPSVTISDSRFYNNRSRQNGEGGGAIYSDSADLVVNNSVFDGNKSNSQNGGGAIYVSNYSNPKKGSLTVNDSRFVGNSAAYDGGAIYADEGSTVSIKGSTFTDNHADGVGGAIQVAEKATVNFAEKNVFQGNTQGEDEQQRLNDIHIAKSGKVVLLEGSDVTLGGGISGKGYLELNNDSVLHINDTARIASRWGKVDGTINMLLTNETIEDGGFELTDILTDKGTVEKAKDALDFDANNLFDVKNTKENTYTITERSSGDIAGRLGVKEADAATLLALSSSKVGSDHADFDELHALLRGESQYGNNTELLSRAADALGADAAPVVQTRETMLSNMIFDAASDALDDNASAMVVGQASGDSLVEKAKIWIKGLFNSADKDDTDKAHGFDMDTYGVAMGADKEIGAGKVGLGYAYNQSDINGYTRDTDVDTHSLFVYGQYQPADWYVKGVASYSWSDYEEKKSVLGKNADAKYDVNTWALEGLYGYNFHLGDDYDVTPEGGLRYLHASQDSYTNGLGVRVKDRDIDVLTAVAGVKAAKNFALSNGMNIRPEVRAALTYDLSTDDNESSVVLTNGQAIRVDGEELDRFGVEFGAKLATDITSNWEVAAGYEGRFRDDYSDHTGILSAKYRF